MNHLDDSSLRLVRALSGTEQKTSITRGLFSSQYSAGDILVKNDLRNSLFELLRPEEAASLAHLLKLIGDPYKELSRQSFRKNSEAQKILFEFFGIEASSEHIESYSLTTEEINPDYGLFDHQRKAVEQVRREILSGNRVVLHMPTGSGKTRSAMHVICDHLVRHPDGHVIWLASSEELCEQAATEFKCAWKSRGNQIMNLVRYWGANDLNLRDSKCGLIVAGFAKLYSLAKQNPAKIADIGDEITLIVVDEAHQAIAPTYRLVIDGIAARKSVMPILGLTATPGRTWNEPEKDKELADFFGGRKVTLEVPGYDNPVDFLINEGYLARPQFRSLKHYGVKLSNEQIEKFSKDLEIPSTILSALAEDEVRTLKIINELEALSRAHARIIAFATTVKHAESIALIMNSRGLSARAVTACSTQSDRFAAITWFKERSLDPRILVNYGVLTTGFDAPQTSAALIARPTKSLVLYSQMVGRAIRGVRAGGNSDAEIITVVDVSLPGFGDISDAFKNWEDVW